MPTLLSLDQVAGALGVSERTVSRMAHAGTIPAVNVGSDKRPRYRITEEALAAFVRERTASPA